MKLRAYTMNLDKMTGIQLFRASHPSAGQGIRNLLIGFCCIPIFVLIGCSKAATPTASDVNTDQSASLADQESQTRVPDALQQLERTQLLASSVPSIYSSEMLANSGLQVAYSSADQQALVPASLIDNNSRRWLCTDDSKRCCYSFSGRCAGSVTDPADHSNRTNRHY